MYIINIYFRRDKTRTDKLFRSLSAANANFLFSAFDDVDEIVSNKVFRRDRPCDSIAHISTRGPYYYFGNYPSSVIYRRIKGQQHSIAANIRASNNYAN